MNKLFLIRSTEPDPDLFPDLLVVADDKDHAMRFWSAYFIDHDKPSRVMIHELPDPSQRNSGVLEWGTLPIMHYEVHDAFRR